MPIYDYRCPLCNNKVTLNHSIHDSSEQLCANCKVVLIKEFSAPGLAFKGNGWAHKE